MKLMDINIDCVNKNLYQQLEDLSNQHGQWRDISSKCDN